MGYFFIIILNVQLLTQLLQLDAHLKVKRRLRSLYVYKNRGGGAAENIIKAGTSNQLLYNDKEVILKENFLNLVYPVGSIYWSSNNTNPANLFGGTWTQIKDRFILAAGDSYSNGATGGAATVTLTVNNMPSHSLSFTPSGNVSSHSHSFTPSGNVSSHSHSFTPSGTVSSHHHTGPSHYHGLKDGTANVSTSTSTSITHWISQYENFNGSRRAGDHLDITDDIDREKVSITASSTSTSIISGNTESAGSGNTGDTAPSFTGTAGNTGETAPSFTGTAGYTGSTEPSFTGTAGYTGSSGSGSSFSILPPYVVKYCWERTA